MVFRFNAVVTQLVLAAFFLQLPRSAFSDSPIQYCNLDSGKPILIAQDELQLPQSASIPANTPEAPPQLGNLKTIEPIGCQRAFFYKGTYQSVDSFHKRDGEKLRPILADTPSAIAELDTYQRNKEKIKVAGYFSTAGVLIFITGLIVKSSVDTQAGRTIGNIATLGGLGIAGGSFLYSLSIRHSNESHLTGAVENFNSKHPNEKIELQLNTGILF